MSADALLTEYVELKKKLAAAEARIAELERDAVDKACAWDAIAQKNARIAELEAALRDLQSYACAGYASWAEDDEHAAMMSRVNCLLGDK